MKKKARMASKKTVKKTVSKKAISTKTKAKKKSVTKSKKKSQASEKDLLLKISSLDQFDLSELEAFAFSSSTALTAGGATCTCSYTCF